jgi:hypothetical protein
MYLFPIIIIVIKATITDSTKVIAKKFSHGFVFQHVQYLIF